MMKFEFTKRISQLVSLLLLVQNLFSQPTISSFTPSAGIAGSSVVINGTNFSSVSSNNTVYFGAVKATILSSTTSSLIVTVPNSASYGPLSVNSDGLTAYSGSSFISTFSNGESITNSSFSDKSDLTSGESPYDIVSGDLDGDGKIDLVTANGGYPYSLSIYRNASVVNSGVITFDNKIDISTGIGPFGIALSDIDGDSKLDIVVTNRYSFTVSIFRNVSSVGAISFSARKDFSAQNPDHITISDLNKDGKPDLVVNNFASNKISIFRNTSASGIISFSTRTNYTTGNLPDDVAVGDIDGDSWNDIVVVCDGDVTLFRNTGSADISFNSTNNAIPGLNANSVLLADCDGDYKPDLVAAKDSAVVLFRNVSNPNTIAFDSPLEIAISRNTGMLAVADLDGNGKPDIATSKGSILSNTSVVNAISFQYVADFLTGETPYDITIDDLDGDNKPDLACVDQSKKLDISIKKSS